MTSVRPLWRRALRRGLYAAAGAAENAGPGLRRAGDAIASEQLRRADDRGLIAEAMRSWGALSNPDEPYFRERYLEWIEAELDRHGCDRSGEFLDAGCGPGRILVPLAERVRRASGSVTGVDLLEGEIEAATRYANEQGVSNVRFVASDVLDFLRGQPSGRYEAALFLEVAYLQRELDLVVAEFARVLKPGGALLVSFTPLYFLVLHGVEQRSWQLAETVLSQRSGVLPGLGWHTWHTPDDARALLERAGFEDVSLTGLGACSGIVGDPLALIARPSELAQREQERLSEVERVLGERYPGVGRYLLASARTAR